MMMMGTTTIVGRRATCGQTATAAVVAVDRNIDFLLALHALAIARVRARGTSLKYRHNPSASVTPRSVCTLLLLDDVQRIFVFCSLFMRSSHVVATRTRPSVSSAHVPSPHSGQRHVELPSSPHTHSRHIHMPRRRQRSCAHVR